jgi:hypothetical protein
MAAPRAPKQWSLTKTETINSFENWKSNLIYVLSLDNNFTDFLRDGATWQKKGAAANRGLQADGEPIAEPARRTAAQKAASLDLMLGQIANFCPVISRNRIIKSSTSLNDIWQAIRLHFGFQNTGAYFLDIAQIKLEPNERPEDLFQRITAAVEDSLLSPTCGISHHGEAVAAEEELTPTLENFIVLTWLRLIHPDLPALVKQRYGTELRSKTLSSIKPEISSALSSLLDEIQSTDNIRSFRLSTTRRNDKRTPYRQSTSVKVCPLCKQAGRPKCDHFLSSCPHLPEQDKRYIRTRSIDVHDDESHESEDPDILCVETPNDMAYDGPTVSRVSVRSSPHIEAFHNQVPLRILLDSGAESSMIRADEAERLGLKISPNATQIPSQADGGRMSGVLGECKATFYRHKLPLYFDALVVSELASPIIAGNPFLESNGFNIDFKRRSIQLRDGSECPYSSPKVPQSPQINRISTAVVRMSKESTTLWPGDFLELPVPGPVSDYSDVVLEPRSDSLSPDQIKAFPTSVYKNVAGFIRVPNVSSGPIHLAKNLHLFNAVPVVDSMEFSPHKEEADLPSRSGLPSGTHFADLVNLNPDKILNQQQVTAMSSMMSEFGNVFNPDFPGYNGALGPFHAVVNIGPVQPPQHKGRLPLYGRKRLVDLQLALDDLEAKGVIATPESAGTVVEYLNPAFLVNKPNGGHRLVTAFTEVAKYSKPSPSLLPDVNQVLRQIAGWKYIIVSDLTSAYHQIPLHPDSRKYCGIVTPFRGVRVYCRSAMGMPGSETALEELLSRTLGDLLMRGVVAKLADDLYCGGNSFDELLANWKSVLSALSKCDLRLSATKTIVCPSSTTILGWRWNQGEISATAHSLCALATCDPPTTVCGLRSFIGSYKALSRVIPGTSVLLGPLDDIVAGLPSSSPLQWTDESLATFKKAQYGLDSHQSVVLPQTGDELWLVTDAAARPTGIGATLYVRRHSIIRAAGFFSCKLKKHQRNWLPCELEALAIATALKHYKPYFIQSTESAFLLTDSKPCVEAIAKLRRGEFSNSPRVSSFLSMVSQFPGLTVMHLSGKDNIPTDFASRHSLECTDTHCQVCSFVELAVTEPVINALIQDTLLEEPMYTSHSAWYNIQHECPSLRRVYAHLRQGTRPSKKDTKSRDVKSYLNHVTIASDGLLVVPHQDILGVSRNKIVVPRQVSHGLATAIHLRLNHPSFHQLKTVFSRYFFILGMENVLRQVTDKCDQCQSLRNKISVPPTFSTEPPPETILGNFAADVMKRSRQLILVLRECSTSYTSAIIVPDERATSLRDALIALCVPLGLLDGPPAIIRCDPAPGFQALVKDAWLADNRLQIEIGEAKNQNKNPVAERAIQEMREELRKIDPLDNPVSAVQLALATARLNSKIRSNGLSSREFLFQRDQFNGSQLPLTDVDLIDAQHARRLANHVPSAQSKVPHPKIPPTQDFCVGDLVYVNSDRDKSRARNRYLVTSVDPNWLHISKFVGRQLRAHSYKVRPEECYHVPSQIPFDLRNTDPYPSSDLSDDDEEVDASMPVQVPVPPPIPAAILPRAPDSPVRPSHTSAPFPDPVPSQVPDPPVLIPSDTDSQAPPVSSRQTGRLRRPPEYLKDYITDFTALDN